MSNPKPADAAQSNTCLYIGRDIQHLLGSAPAHVLAGLSDAGVVIEHLDPRTLAQAKRDGGEAFKEVTARIQGAHTVMVGPTDYDLHVLAIVMLRRGVAGDTWLDRWHGDKVGGLTFFPNVMEHASFRVMAMEAMIPALYARHVHNTSLVAPSAGEAGPLPTLPLPFRDPAWGLTEIEMSSVPVTRLFARAESGRLDLFEAAYKLRTVAEEELAKSGIPAEGASRLFYRGLDDLSSYLVWLTKRTPVDRLPEWGDPRMSEVWATLARNTNEVIRKSTGRAIWSGLVRDRGQFTLAALPPALHARRASIEQGWDARVAYAQSTSAEHNLSLQVHSHYWETKAGTVLNSAVIPQEDPFEGEAVGPAYLPTLHTLRSARRYRSAPEVVLLTHKLFGARTFVPDHAGRHLSEFVEESPPISRAEIGDWCRVLNTLATKRTVLKRVVDGCLEWRIIPPEIYGIVAGVYPLVSATATNHPGRRLPWLDGNCQPRAEFLEMDLPGALESFRERERVRATFAVKRPDPKVGA